MAKPVPVKDPSLDDPINTNEWQCVMVLAVEKNVHDNFLIRRFCEGASAALRQEIKSIDLNYDVMKVIRLFIRGALDYKYSFLLNFPTVFEEAIEIVRNNNNTAAFPRPLLIKIIRALVLMYKAQDIERRIRRNEMILDPVKLMSMRPAVPGGPAKGGDKGKAKESKKPTGAGTGFQIKPASPGKLDTKLLRRGEGVKESEQIDDAPANSPFKIYILLTGFHDPELPLHLLKADFPLYGIFCIDSSFVTLDRISSTVIIQRTTVDSTSNDIEPVDKIQKFWSEFLRILWEPQNIQFFKETVFQIYRPTFLPPQKSGQQEFMYRELSFLLYDMADLRRQLKYYLRNTKLWDVTQKFERVEPVLEYARELDEVPCELVTVPVVVQFILDQICGEDNIQEDFALFQESSMLEGTKFTKTLSEYSELPPLIPECSDFSIITHLSSTIRFPTPDWSEIIDEINDDVRRSLHEKMKLLDEFYDMDEEQLLFNTYQSSASEIPSIAKELIPKQRLQAENLEAALKYIINGGVLGSYWNEFPPSTFKEIFDRRSSFAINLPQIIMDYCLYILWISKISCEFQHSNYSMTPRESLRKNSSALEIIRNQEIGPTNFTVTETSRTALKIPASGKNKGGNFFSPSNLKIVSPATVRAFSAPENNPLNVLHAAFMSDSNILKKEEFEVNVYEDIRTFLGEDIFLNSNDFDFVEEYNKSKMFKNSEEACDDYSCIDYIHSELTDAIFLILHKRMDENCIFREPFNISLRTPVGMRDFFQYVLEDESEWIEIQEAAFRKNQKALDSAITPNPLFNPTPDFRDFRQEDFYVENSLKHELYLKLNAPPKLDPKAQAAAKAAAKAAAAPAAGKGKAAEKVKEPPPPPRPPSPTYALPEEPYVFDAYNVSNVAVQFSGLRTVFFGSDNCSVKVELEERLYGSQTLSVQIRKGGHVLHLYSYVCPKPHLQEPYVCHLTLKKGIILAFSRKMKVSYIEVEEIVRDPQAGKNKKPGAVVPEKVAIKRVPVLEEDNSFIYNLKLSIPSGLQVEVMRRIIDPCYIKQHYILQPPEYSKLIRSEKCRLFLPDGTVVRMLQDGTINVLRIDTQTITSTTKDLVQKIPRRVLEIYYKEVFGSRETYSEDGQGEEILMFESFQMVTSSGYYISVFKEEVISFCRCHTFQNTDVETNTSYIRRRDKTNYVFFDDGMLVVEFQDGTKISSIFYEEKADIVIAEEEEVPGECDESFELSSEFGEELPQPEGFVSVHMKIIMEHPDYATIIYDTSEKSWDIQLPFGSSVKVEPNGTYSVQMDKNTEYEITETGMQMSRFNSEDILICDTKVDFTGFQKDESKRIYCETKDHSGKKFVIEKNANCYVKYHQTNSARSSFAAEPPFSQKPSQSEAKGAKQGRKLTTENRYFVLRRDLTGFELMHKENARIAIANLDPSGVLFSDVIPGLNGLRYFALLTEAPEEYEDYRKWCLKTITPNPVYTSKRVHRTYRTTFGVPPTWMHPYPNKRREVQVPERLTCRILIESKKSDFYESPKLGSFAYCEIQRVEKPKYTVIEPGVENIQKFFRKVAQDNQNILKEMFVRGIQEKLDSLKKFKPVNNEKVKHYLEMSDYYENLRGFHKKSIRFKVIPNYFEHPSGMSWLILQELNEDMMVSRKPTAPPPTPACSKLSRMNNNININIKNKQLVKVNDKIPTTSQFKPKTPERCKKQKDCKCKVKKLRLVKSEPSSASNKSRKDEKMETLSNPEVDYRHSHFQKRSFTEEDLLLLQHDDRKSQVQISNLVLEDVMNFGWV